MTGETKQLKPVMPTEEERLKMLEVFSTEYISPNNFDFVERYWLKILNYSLYNANNDFNPETYQNMIKEKVGVQLTAQELAQAELVNDILSNRFYSEAAQAANCIGVLYRLEMRYTESEAMFKQAISLENDPLVCREYDQDLANLKIFL